MRKAWFSLILASSMMISIPAFAQNEDFGKSAVARSLMNKATQNQEKTATKTVTIVKPASPYEYQETIPDNVDALMERVELQNGALVEEFEQLLQKDPLNPDAPKWLSQIAEFHWQMAHYSYLRARRSWIAELDKCVDDDSKCPPEPVADYSQAIADYRRILSQYPDYKQTDDVLFRLGDALIRNQQSKEGIGYLHKLTQTYPNYKDLDAAYLAMGEFYFSQKNTGTAQAAYQTIINNYPKSTYYQYAQYKLAWTYLNLAEEDDYIKAIELFKNVVESIDTQYASAIDAEGQIDENKLKAGEVSFRNQALNDLSTTYAELPDGWKEARTYLQTKLPKDKARDKIEQLGAILDAQGKLEEELDLYNDLIAENPEHPHLPEWYKARISAFQQANRMADADAETRKAIAALLPDQRWYQANESANPNSIKHARQFCADNIYTIAINDITAIEKTPDAQKDSLWKDAEDMLRTELKYFAEGSSAFDIQYSFAYVLDERSDAELAHLKKQYGKKLTSDPSLASGVLPRLKEAAQAYQKIIDWPNPQDDAQNEQIQIAANRQVFVYANILATSDPEWSIINSAKATNFVEEKRGSEIHPKEALSTPELDFVRSAEQYAHKYPHHEETPAFLWRAAEIYRSHYDYDQAAQRFDEIVSNFPDHQYAAVSVGSMFELYYKANNYEKIEYWAKWLIETKNFKHYNAKELEDTAAFAIDKQAVAHADNHRIDDAVSTMNRIETSFPERKDLITAAHFKSANFEESRKGYAAAIQLLQPIESNADTPRHGLDATWLIAQHAFRLSRYPLAAEKFGQTANAYLEIIQKQTAPASDKAADKKKSKSGKTQPETAKPETDKEAALRFAQSVFYGAQLYRALGNNAKSIELIHQYLQANAGNTLNLYKQNDEFIILAPEDDKSNAAPLLTNPAAILELSSIQADSERSEAIKCLSEFVDSESFAKEEPATQRQILFQLIQYAVDDSNTSQADKAFARLKPDENTWSRTELAKNAYLHGRRTQIDFDNVVLEFPVRTLKKRIEEKAKKRQAAEKYYQEAISYKIGSVSTAAAYSLAQMALQFRDAFKNLPAPKELENDPAALEDYNIWIEDELIFPAEDAAASLLEFAHQITLQLESYTKYAHDSAQTLAELKPDLYPVANSTNNE